MVRREGKGTVVFVAIGLVTWGIQQFTAGATAEGAIAALVGLLLVIGYQALEDSDHRKAADDVVGMLGEETFRELSQWSADELRALRAEVSNENTEG